MKSAFLILMACLVLLAACSEEPWAEPFPVREQIVITDSIGIETGDPDYMLGSVIEAAYSPEGMILVLDRSAGIVRRYDETGLFNRNLSRQGDGPGELNHPYKLSLFSDGRMLIWDIGKQCTMVLSSEGERIRDITLSGYAPPSHPVALSNDRYAAADLDISLEDDQIVIIISPSVFDLETGEALLAAWSDTLFMDQSEVQNNMSVNGLLGYTLMFSDGNEMFFYATVSEESYEVTAISADGEVLFCTGLDMPLQAKTPEEIEEERQFWATTFGMDELPEQVSFSSYHNLLAGLGVDGSGNLWVQRATEPKPVFDVFDEEGTHISTVEFPREGRWWGFHINPWGALAWNSDPLDGVQKVYMLELPEL